MNFALLLLLRGGRMVQIRQKGVEIGIWKVKHKLSIYIYRPETDQIQR